MAQLNESSQLKQIIQSIDFGIFLVDPTNHEIVYANDYFFELVGGSSETVYGRTCHGFVCPNQVGQCPITDFNQTVSRKECTLLALDGEEIPVYKTVKKIKVNGNTLLLESLIDIRKMKEAQLQLIKAYEEVEAKVLERTKALSDANKSLEIEIQERKRISEELRNLAMTDPLTGTANRRQFLETFSVEIQRNLRYKHSFAYLTYDIDEFKSINDTYGHDVGDSTLIYVTQKIRSVCREVDEIGRLGGDEFGIILPEITPENARNVARRIRESLSEGDHYIQGYKIPITISVGLTCYVEGDTIETIMKRADDALYSSKKNGRNRVTVL